MLTFFTIYSFKQAFLGGLVLLSELLPIPLPIRCLEVCLKAMRNLVPVLLRKNVKKILECV